MALLKAYLSAAEDCVANEMLRNAEASGRYAAQSGRLREAH